MAVSDMVKLFRIVYNIIKGAHNKTADVQPSAAMQQQTASKAATAPLQNYTK
jgi:hypothetical protein